MELAMSNKFVEMQEKEMMEVDGGSFLAAGFVLSLKVIKVAKVVVPVDSRAIRHGIAGAASYAAGSRASGRRPTANGALGAVVGAAVGFGILGGK